MYIIKNALRSISRSKGRNVLIGVIILVIAISACVALSIRQAAESAREKSLEGLKITAQISVDRQKMMESFQQNQGESTDRSAMQSMLQSISGLGLDEMKTYSEAAAVSDFYYSDTVSFNAGDDIEAIDTSSTSDSEDDSTADDTQQQQSPGGEMGGPGGETAGGEGGGMGGMGGMGRMGTQGDFTVIGYSSDNAMTSFTDGTCYITDGAIFDEGSDEDTCIISDELAVYNNFEVGGTFTLVNPNDDEEIITLTIVGIYHNDESTVSSEGMMRGFSASSDPANQIYMSSNALQSITAESAENATVETDEDTGIETTTALREQLSGTYVFADADAYNSFESQVRAMGLSDDYTVSSSDLNSYEESLQPLENLSKYATYFFFIVLAIGGIILVVLNIFNIRERKYEIGVLAAIGMKKWKIGTQFITELFCVTFIAIIIGTGIGSAVSLPVTNALLEQQITAQEEKESSQQQNFGRQMGGGQGGAQMSAGDRSSGFSGFGQSTADYISEVSSATDLTVVLQLIGVGILLTLISGLSAVTFVLRYDPLKILTNRD